MGIFTQWKFNDAGADWVFSGTGGPPPDFGTWCIKANHLDHASAPSIAFPSPEGGRFGSFRIMME